MKSPFTKLYIGESFLFLICISLLLHVCLFVGLYYFPKEPPPPPHEPDFTFNPSEMPPLIQPPTPDKLETKRHSEQQIRVPRETAPRGDAAKDFQALNKQQAPPTSSITRPTQSTSQTPSQQQVDLGSSMPGLSKQKAQTTQQTQSVSQPSSGGSELTKLSSAYGRKYEKDVTEENTRSLNSDDIQLASFFRRFENAVYGVWVYPREATLRGIEGTALVRITFNRLGEITDRKILDSTREKILDDEIYRALDAIGPLGRLPKEYKKEELHLTVNFHYGSSRRILR